MTTNLGTVTSNTAAPPAVSLRGLRTAVLDLGSSIVLPFVALLALQIAFQAMPVVISRPLGLGGPALVTWLLWRRRSAFALWPAFILALQVHATIWGAIPLLGRPVSVDYAITIDRALGLGEVPTLEVQAIREWAPHALDVAAFGVYASFFAAPFLGFLGAWRADRDAAARFARAVTCASFLGLSVMIALPTAPPWMASEEGALPHVDRVGELLIGKATQSEAEQIIGLNETAAMPSLHTASTVLVALLVGSVVPGWRRRAWLYPLAMGFALVYMGEHYLIDVLAGVLTAVVAWRLAGTARGPFAAAGRAPAPLEEQRPAQP